MAERLDFTIDPPSNTAALTKKPSEIDLDNVSKNVGGNWRSLLTHLGVPSAKCKALLQESSSNTESACFQGLVFWREGNKPCKEASWSVLLEALEKGAERGDYAETLRREIVDGATCYQSVHSEVSNQVNAGDSKLQTSSGSKYARLSAVRVHHPLENTFIALCDNIQRIVAGKGYPPLEDLKRYYLRLLKGQEKLIQKLRRAHTYEEVLEIVFEESDWMSFDNIEMMVDFFKLDPVDKMIDGYKLKLSSVLTQRLTQITEKMADLPPEYPMGRADLEKMVVCYNLDADGITLEDLLRHRQFLSSRLKIPNHLLSFLEILIGSVILVFGMPEKFVRGVVKKIEEVWRELWREGIVSIEVKGRVYDMIKMANKEKENYIPHGSHWDIRQIMTIGSSLYEEYGRHPSLQTAVQIYKEAGDPKAVEKGSLIWLFHHHVPEESHRLLVDPYAVLGRTLFLGGCDMWREHALRGNLPEALNRWSVLCMSVFESYVIPMDKYVLMAELPLEWVKLLYNKYCHLESFQREVGVVKDVQNMSEEELERVKGWLRGWFRVRSSHAVKALVECGIDDEEVWHFIQGLPPKLSGYVTDDDPRVLDPRRWRYEEVRRHLSMLLQGRGSLWSRSTGSWKVIIFTQYLTHSIGKRLLRKSKRYLKHISSIFYHKVFMCLKYKP